MIPLLIVVALLLILSKSSGGPSPVVGSSPVVLHAPKTVAGGLELLTDDSGAYYSYSAVPSYATVNQTPANTTRVYFVNASGYRWIPQIVTTLQ